MTLRSFFVSLFLFVTLANSNASSVSEKVAERLKEMNQVTPVQKVIQLMEGMIQKGTEEKNAEAVQFVAYKTFCDTTAADKNKAITEANAKIEKLQADIEKFSSDADGLGTVVASLDADLATWQNDVKAAMKVRDIEVNDYTATHADYSSSIEALQNGADTLRAQNHDMEQASSALVQVRQQSFITPEAKRAIDNFLAMDHDVTDENLAVAAPEAKGFESQLQGLIDMLDGLHAKFVDERTKLEKEESEAKHASEMLMADLKAQIEAGTESRNEKAEAKAQALQDAADSKGDLTDTSTTRDEDQKYVSDLIAACELKSVAFADRQTLRGEEIEAIQKAIEILSSGAVAGASEKHLPQLVQTTASSLAQLRAEVQSPSQSVVAAFLKSQAKRIDSRVLAMIALRVEADPFKKVKKMIKDLVVKLMEEATSEAETKGFCDTELGTNEHTRKEKTSQVEMLTADIDELSSSVTSLTEELADLGAQLAELNNAIEKATAVRNAEKRKNRETIKDAQDAQDAVAKALTVLKEFYDKAAQATAFTQEPEIFSDEPYKGMGGESGGVVGMIEVIASDFARLESETKANEAAAAEEFETFMHDSTMDKTLKTKDVEHKTQKKEMQAQALQEKKSDLAGTQKELDAAMKYYEKLKPTCISGGSESFEDRVAQRKEEIESLQEALRIFNGEDIALLQRA